MKIVLGTMEIGRTLKLDQTNEIIKYFVSKNFNEIDTASLYSNSETECILGEAHLKNLQVSTKAFPGWNNMAYFNKDNIVEQFNTSLKNLNLPKVDILYLHWPCKNTKIENTLEAIDQLYNEGKFERFGISNYSSWQVARIFSLCERLGYITPSVYQGMYNMLTRRVEEELIPCIREFNMSFYAYNPLAGGLLTGKYKYEDLSKFDSQTTRNRFFGLGGSWAKSYQDRFWKKSYFKALDNIKTQLKLEENSTTLTETSFIWLKNHSVLNKENDAIIIGASSMNQFKENIDFLTTDKKLSTSVLDVIDQSYNKYLKTNCPSYFR